MSWRKLEEEDSQGVFRDVDLVVRQTYIYIPTDSVLRREFEYGNRRYDVFYDDETMEVAIVPNPNGHYLMPKNYIISSAYKSQRVHKVVAVFVDVLGIGKYRAVERKLFGRKAYVFSEKTKRVK